MPANFERLLCHRYEDHAFELQRDTHIFGDRQVPIMNWVERAAKQPDTCTHGVIIAWA